MHSQAISLVLFALVSLALALPSTKRASGVTTDPSQANGQSFDYIVIGAGLTGTTVTARLAEDSSVTVLLIEAGGDDRGDPRVYDIYAYGQAFGSELVWSWPTDGGLKSIAGGKTLGGSSSINGGAYTRGLDAQFDAWSSLLEEDEASAEWSWESIFSYMKKSETFSPPNEQQSEKGAQYIEEYHGYAGPVQVTYPDQMYVSTTPLTIDWHHGDNRSSSVEAYLTPVEDARPNWLTLVEHQVTKINWANADSIPLTASGVEFAPASGGSPRYTAFANREVIVACGAIQSPALLQLSGIGDSNVLGPLGISTYIDLKTVGKNLQEQTMNSLGVIRKDFDTGGDGPSDAIAYPNIYQVFGGKAADSISKIQSNLSSWATSQAGSALNADALQQIYRVQADLIINKNAPIVEYFFDTGYPDCGASVSTLGINQWQLLPFSRGTVHISTTNPFTHPTINVNYFSVDWDLDVQIASARLSRTVLSTGECQPAGDVPDDADRGSEEDWAAWIRCTFFAVSHPIGTLAMMKRSLGGVVDSQLKVYDASNIRVVDASVMPLQVSAHLAASLYGVAEKAADLIKASYRASCGVCLASDQVLFNVQ
ncbi:glucose oxidase [Desarmillaria tabescens]|uniref:Glucose oxidase n=1 Tax=Armillaria tabescens TaxID=1929756 RepID=A0AA39KEA1_ARMTA|nr:glucose oxidase [Desarmillaria tabescens]KAK0458306.1 glucose oxidase [Desarmillaria tabescens]